MQRNRVSATIDNGGDLNLLIDSSKNINLGAQSNRIDCQKDNFSFPEALENQELLEMLDKGRALSDLKNKSDDHSIPPKMEKPKNQLTRFINGEVATDQLAAYRRKYHIPFDEGINPNIWENHEGTKLVILNDKVEDGKTILTFRLYDYRYCELYPSQQFVLDREIRYLAFQLSHDEQFLGIFAGNYFDSRQLFLCCFENGFENDIFIEREIGQRSLDKMSLTMFKLDQPILGLRISSLNHLFVKFREQKQAQLSRSKLTIKELIDQFQRKNQVEEELSIRDDFEVRNEKFHSLEILEINGPFAVGFDNDKKIYVVYNYEEEKFLEWDIEDQNLLFQEQQMLEGRNIFDNVIVAEGKFSWHFHKIFVNLIFNKGSFSWQFFFFCPKKLYIFSLKDNKLSPINNGFTFDREEGVQVRHIFSSGEMICQSKGLDSIFFYKIDYSKSQIELLLQRKMKNQILPLNQMKQSSLIYAARGEYFLNYYSSPVKNCVSTIAMTQPSDNVVGINCFGELLLKSELIAYARNNFSQQIIGDKLLFYSKRLNLYVYEDGKGERCCIFVKNLNDSHELFKEERQIIKNIKSQVIEGREILRIFTLQFNKVTLYSFFNDNAVIKSVYQTERNFKIFLSEESNEIALISSCEQRQLKILKINENHELYVSGEGQVKEFQGIQIDEPDYRTIFLHRILIIGRMLVRFSEDYSQIDVVTRLGYDIVADHYFQSQNKWLIIRINTFYHIFEIENLQLQMVVTNCEELVDLDKRCLVPDYRYRQDDENFLYHSYQILSTSQAILRRTQLLDKNMIFGIPLFIAVKPCLVSVFDMKSKNLNYYPMKPDGQIDFNAPLTCTQLKFNLDWVTEYQDIDDLDQLINREQKIIEKINNVESSIIDFTGYNLLYHEFSLQQLQQQPNANKILSHIMKKLQLNSDQEKPMPYLMFEDKFSSSPLQLALQKQNPMLVKQLMELCINQDKEGLLYSAYYSPLLSEMKTLGIDLKPLFNSSILFHRIDNQNPNFDEFDQDLKYCIIHSNANSLYDVLYREKLEFHKKEENKQAQNIEYYVVNMKDQTTNEEAQEESNKDRNIKNPKFIIQLFDELSDSDLSYLEIELVQVIINFKWKSYTFNYFLYQFCLWLIFTVCLITDIAFGIKQYQIENDYGFYVTRGICQSILLWFLSYEVLQFMKGKLDYFSSLWNISDLCLQLLYPAYILVSFQWKSQIYVIKCIQSGIIILTFVKFLFFLRIFRQFSFLIQMLAAVFRDLIIFLYFFGFVLGFFSILLGVLLNDVDDYEGIGPVGYFTIALRQALGDYVTDSYAKNSDFKVLTWIVYLMVMILGNVIFMNFIIAVVSQSYENCMQKSVAQSFKVKLHMIRERELIMSEQDYNNKEWFPNYIILCKPIFEGSNADSDNMENEWNGVLREMEKVVKRQIEVVNQQQNKITNGMNDRIDKLSNEMKKMEMKSTEMNNNIENELKKSTKMNKKLDKKMDELKNFLTNNFTKKQIV